MQITMHCSKCQRDLTQGMWTAAQWREQRSDVGGRDECRECWQRGPTSIDWMEVNHTVLLVNDLSLKNVTLVYQDFMTSFLCSMTSEERKCWSHEGFLPVRVPTDYRTHRRRKEVDPRNVVYKNVVEREIPNIQSMMEWSHPPNEVTCGDCIESLLGKATCRRKVSYAGISLRDGAHFFRELSYATWRIHRVLAWHRDTAGAQAGPHAGLHEVLHAPLHLFGCNCGHVMENPHTYTMQCQGCAKCACGLEIHMYRNRLLCRTCFAREMA